MTTSAPLHATAFRRRRFLNWFPMGLTYALLYMGRYNLTVAKTSLGDLMTKEEFGLIFGAGTVVYAFSFLLNGPLVDRKGGRFGMLTAALGSAVANVAMAFYLQHVLTGGPEARGGLVTAFSLLYAINMYFQSFGAVSIVKVNAHWFHVKERGGFSGIFGTMISSGIFLAFTVNGWLLDLAAGWWPGEASQWIVFAGPAALLFLFAGIEFMLLRDRPGLAGQPEFDTGDASSGEDDKPVPSMVLYKRILTNPVILTVALIEFCTGVLRNGVMHWFPIYAKEVWVLPKSHVLNLGQWSSLGLVGGCFAVAAVSIALGARAKGHVRGWLLVGGALAFLAPFVQGGWGGILFIAGVVGANVAGWVSDLFFQSRRGPAAGGLYGLLALCAVGMWATLAPATNEVKVADPKSGLLADDTLVRIAGKPVAGWTDVAPAVACWQPTCKGSKWQAEACICAGKEATDDPSPHEVPGIPATVVRAGQTLDLTVRDPAAVQRAGDRRLLKDQPMLPLSEYWLGLFVFLVSICVIGTHGLLSGTATMDFGGRKGAATAVGVIDGFVYLGTALQSVSLGFLTSRDWSWWPLFLLPFAVAGFLLCTRIWHAVPKGRGGH
ncbi:MAG: MFS transporter [Myxococcales bacterium]|nr:MFS transporter [Myxococcales bacterium]